MRTGQTGRGDDNYKPMSIKDFIIDGGDVVGTNVVVRGNYYVNTVDQAYIGEIMLLVEDADRDARALFYECKSQQCSDITVFGHAIECSAARVNTVTGNKLELPSEPCIKVRTALYTASVVTAK